MMAAAVATIQELPRRFAEARFRQIGEELRAALNQALAAAGLAGACVGLYSNPVLQVDLVDEALRPKVHTLFIQEMARRGVHCLLSFRATLAHSSLDIEATAEAAYESLSVVKRGLDADDLDALLACEVTREPFRRLVR